MAEEYATLDELKAYLAGSAQTITSGNDGNYRDALASAHQGIDDWCGRSFVADTGTSARIYVAADRRLTCDGYVLNVDDFWDTATLAVATDPGGDGTFDTTWVTATDLQPQPLNGIVGGIRGHAYWQLRAIGGKFWPTPIYGRANVQVTAKWGWAAVPDPVKSVCLELAKDIAVSASFRAGAVGFGDAGIARIRDTPSLQFRLLDYQHPDKLLIR